MNRRLVVGFLLGLTVAGASGAKRTAHASDVSSSTYRLDVRRAGTQSPYQRRDTWYDFILKQFNPDNSDYGKWVEQRRREFIELCLRNPYFLYCLWTTIAVLLATALCTKQWIDKRRAMWITAEMMADLYNQDAYSRQAAQEAIERYNNHIERWNGAIEQGENNPGAAGAGSEIEQLRSELMRVAEERDKAVRDRDVAREELRRKSEILADMSVRLDAATGKGTAHGASKTASDLRTVDAKLVNHINTLQEQLYTERTNNRRLRGP